jgi:arsenate reductase-like glutaredoxin family protein
MEKLNYNNLDAETQNRLFSISKMDVEQNYRQHLKSYARENGLSYDDLLNEEAIRNLYNYTFSFSI